MESDNNSARREVGGNILLLRWDESTVDPMVRLFEGAGFFVDSSVGRLSDVEVKNYGAIVHLARTEEALLKHLGQLRNEIQEDEWVMVEGDGEDDYHCTVQLTDHASTSLRLFVRWLWAQANIT